MNSFLFKKYRWYAMKTHEKIRTLRKDKQWSQEEMATRLEMSPAGYAKIERGETRLNLQRLEQIADIFEIDIAELIQHGENIVYQINQGDNYNQNNNPYSHTVIYSNAEHDLKSEIEKLKLIIQHKDELLAQLQKELELKQDLIDVLKSK